MPTDSCNPIESACRPARRGRLLRALLTGALLPLVAVVLLADRVAYSKIVDLHAENDAVRAEHHHDWSRATEDARYKMISTTKDPFTAENTYAYLRLVDKASGRELFRKPVPALTELWISPDSRYVVGLSDILRTNPYHLVVFTRTGRRIFERALTEEKWPSIQQSVTNAILWFKDPNPSIRLEESQGWATLWIEDRLGTPRKFRFKTAE